MTPKQAAKYLNRHYSEKTIAGLVGCKQPAIHKIIHNNQQPFWRLGNRLIKEAEALADELGEKTP